MAIDEDLDQQEQEHAGSEHLLEDDHFDLAEITGGMVRESDVIVPEWADGEVDHLADISENSDGDEELIIDSDWDASLLLICS